MESHHDLIDHYGHTTILYENWDATGEDSQQRKLTFTCTWFGSLIERAYIVVFAWQLLFPSYGLTWPSLA